MTERTDQELLELYATLDRQPTEHVLETLVACASIVASRNRSMDAIACFEEVIDRMQPAPPRVN